MNHDRKKENVDEKKAGLNDVGRPEKDKKKNKLPQSGIS